MSITYIGLIEFPQEFLISGDVLGREFVTQITNALIQMPVVAINGDEVCRNLRSPFQCFEFDVNWGHVVHTDNKDSFVNIAVLILRGDENCVQKAYSSFPNWMYRFMTFVRALSHDLSKELVTEPLQYGSDRKGQVPWRVDGGDWLVVI